MFDSVGTEIEEMRRTWISGPHTASRFEGEEDGFGDLVA